MSYLYLEPILLKELILKKDSFSLTIKNSFKNRILNQNDKKFLILDLKRILRNYQKLSYEELNIFTDYKRNSDEFFFNVVFIFHLRIQDTDKEELKKLYIRRFEYTFDENKKEDNFNKLVASTSIPFKIDEEVKEIPLLYRSLILEIPSFLLNEFDSMFPKKEIKPLINSFYNKTANFYRIKHESKKRDLILKDTDFEKINVFNHLILKTNKSEKEIELKYKDELIKTEYGLELATGNIKLPVIQPTVLLSDLTPNYLVYRMYDRLLSYQIPILDKCFNDEIVYNKAVEIKKTKKLDFYRPILTKNSSLNTNLQEKSYDLVLYFSSCTAISTNNKEYNILPSLSEADLKMSAHRILEELLSLSTFVKKDKYLLYYSTSITKEESEDIKNLFLKKKEKEFEAVIGRYVLPSEMDSSSCYFYVFRRKH